jgi:hypothetical protein
VAVRAAAITEAAVRIIVVGRTIIMVKAVKVAAVARVTARVVRAEDKVARVTARVVRAEDKVVRVTARVVKAEDKVVRVTARVAKVEDKVVRVMARVVEPIKAILTSIGTKISIVMVMVVVRDEAVSLGICSNILNRLRRQTQYNNSALGYNPSLNQKTETKTATRMVAVFYVHGRTVFRKEPGMAVRLL